MDSLHMITFRCKPPLFERLEAFSRSRNIDRTSVLKLAVHYYLNRRNIPEIRFDGRSGLKIENQSHPMGSH